MDVSSLGDTIQPLTPSKAQGVQGVWGGLNSHIPQPGRIRERQERGGRKAQPGVENHRGHSLSEGQEGRLGLHSKFGDLEQTHLWVRGWPAAYRNQGEKDGCGEEAKTEAEEGEGCGQQTEGGLRTLAFHSVDDKIPPRKSRTGLLCPRAASGLSQLDLSPGLCLEPGTLSGTPYRVGDSNRETELPE